MALITNRDQLDIIDNFVADLELSFGVKQRSVSFESLWNASPPTEAGGQSLREYMKHVSSEICHTEFGLLLIQIRPARILSSMMIITASINSARTTRRRIQRLLTSAHLSDGNGVLDNRIVQFFRPRLTTFRDLSAKITEAERDTAIARLEVYRKWFSLEKHNSIVIIPIENI